MGGNYFCTMILIDSAFESEGCRLVAIHVRKINQLVITWAGEFHNESKDSCWFYWDVWRSFTPTPNSVCPYEWHGNRDETSMKT